MSLGEPDFYEVLRVSPSADDTTIKKAFWTLSRALHPDVTRHLSEEERKLAEKQYHKVTLAYNILSDPGKRRRYDESRTKRESTPRAPGPSGESDWPPERPTPPRFERYYDEGLWIRAQRAAEASARQHYRTQQQWQQYAAGYLRSVLSQPEPGPDIRLVLQLSRRESRQGRRFRNPVDGHEQVLPPSDGIDSWVYQYRGGWSRNNGPRGHLYVDLVQRSRHPLEPALRAATSAVVKLLRPVVKVTLWVALAIALFLGGAITYVIVRS